MLKYFFFNFFVNTFALATKANDNSLKLKVELLINCDNGRRKSFRDCMEKLFKYNKR